MTHPIRVLRLAVTALMAAAPIGPALAQQNAVQYPCGSRSEIVDILQKNYGEHRVAQGQAYTGAVAEIFVGPNGTWSIVATAPNGRSCLIGAGDTWTPVEPVGEEI